MIKLPDTTLIATAALFGVVALCGSFWMLTMLSRPSELNGRIGVIESDMRQADGVLRRTADTSHYLPNPLCRTGPSLAGDLVRTELAHAARDAGLGAPSITMIPLGSQDPTSQTFPVTFSVEATGRYDLVLSFLGRLAQSEPEVFADSIDLASKTSAVSLKLTGRVICLASS